LFVFCRELNVNFFVNDLIEKDNYNVHLFYFLIVDNNNNEENFITYKFYYDDERFIVIEIFSLFKVANYLLSLVSYYLVIDFLLESINLFALENVLVFKCYYNNLNIIFFVKFHFIVLS